MATVKKLYEILHISVRSKLFLIPKFRLTFKLFLKINVYENKNDDTLLRKSFFENVIFYNEKNKQIKLNNETLKTFDLIYNEKLTFSLISFLWINKIYVIVIALFMILILKLKKKRKIKHRRLRTKVGYN